MFSWRNNKNIYLDTTHIWSFVCVGVLWPSQPNGVMSSAVSLPNHMVTGATSLNHTWAEFFTHLNQS